MCNKLFCVNKAFQVVIFSFFLFFFDIELFILQSFLRVGRQKDRECSCRPDIVCLFLRTTRKQGKEEVWSARTCNLSHFFHYLCENRAVPNNEFRLKMKSEFITLATTKMKLVRYRDVTWTKRTFYEILKHEVFLLKTMILTLFA